MIKKVLKVLENGLMVMRLNSGILLVGVLVFAFPLLFLWVTQGFLITASNNIETIEKKRVNNMHFAYSSALKNHFTIEQLDAMTTDLLSSNSNPDVKSVRIINRDETGYKIITGNKKEESGTYLATTSLLYNLAFSENNDFLILNYIVDNNRTWHIYSRVKVGNDFMYIFTLHDFSIQDKTLTSRIQKSYFGLTWIFVFLISLAYWLYKQTNWQKNHSILEKQLEERDLFSNMIAHEFRSPLTAIKGYSSFLQESKTLSPEEVRFASNISNSASRLVVLVNDFLEVARLQSGKLKIEKSEIDLRDVLTSVTSDLKIMAEEKNLSLTYVTNKKPVMISTDGARMTQVLTNIISNSIKYTNSGEVVVECEDTPGEIILKVKDTGTGISAEDQQKLFAPFTRVGGVDQSSVIGTGLGMWITKQLVTLLDGKIGVESIKGVGTHVVIQFRT